MHLINILFEGVKNINKFFQNYYFKGEYSTAFIAEKDKDGYNSYLNEVTDKDNLYAVVSFVNYKYLLRAASISNQLQGFNKTVSNNGGVLVMVIQNILYLFLSTILIKVMTFM